jgi:hypothetical protein
LAVVLSLSRHARSFLVWCALSVGLHAAAFETLRTRSLRPVTDVAPAPDVSGETLDVQAPAAPETEAEPPDAPARESPTEEPAVNGAASVRPARSAVRPVEDERREHRARELFGAVGARFATDLSATFTRAIPQAFSADPAWIDAPLGDAGAVDVTLVLDEAGHLEASPLAGRPSRALRSSIARTLALLGERSFTAHQATTRLRLTAHVTRDDLHDGLHGDVFALSGGSFAGTTGSAFFALPAPSGAGSGRRVDVELRLVR